MNHQFLNIVELSYKDDSESELCDCWPPPELRSLYFWTRQICAPILAGEGYVMFIWCLRQVMFLEDIFCKAQVHKTFFINSDNTLF